MKTYLYKSDEEKLISFEVSNTLIGRRRVVKILNKIPEVEIIQTPKFLSWLREDVFCRFKLKNKTFTVEEPFGDNSRYLICSSSPEPCAEIEIIEKVFSEA